ncbi:flavin reductase (NADPH)-like [Mizuhopecten yessoensis]|uniref:flavin reductase (NADPH)-like n=1 Tax=Mizuhopecten yessoensis TaxID=6573 RepID=UPI000B459A4B|nr:flavin reductase (NADPH)-like [Mizuhopecten yessoensis]
MKIAVLGATGPSGLQLVQESLERGHEVTALVRNPDKLSHIDDAKLKVEKVDIFNEADLNSHFGGCDVVMSCLGTAPSLFGMSTLTFYLDSIKPIIGAMRKCGNTRLVTMTAVDTIPQNRGPWIFEWIIRPVFLSSVLQSMSVMEDYLQKECQDIDFTVVKPPGLTNEPSSGTEVKGAEGQYIEGTIRRISRRDVAKFMLDCIPLKQWVRKLVSIGLPV